MRRFISLFLIFVMLTTIFPIGPTSAVFAVVDTLTYSATEFTEAVANDGSISTTINLSLSTDTFVVQATTMTLDTHYSVANVPAGLTVVVTGTSASTATVTLTGNATNHNNGDDIANLTLNFLDAAFTGNVAADITNATRSDLVVNFADPSLSYDVGTLSESVTNDGTITTTVTATLTGDTFVTTGGAMTLTTEYTVANVPSGLLVAVTGTSATTATIELTGTASSHTNADDIANLTVNFADGAFSGSTAAEVTNASKADYVVDFIDIGLSYDSTSFTEVAGNDGSTTTTLNITLSGDTFTVPGGVMTAGNHYTVANIPLGLTAVITGTSGTTATLTLSGNATNHNSADNASNLTVSFNDAAFANAPAANITNASLSTLSIAFSDPSISYSGGTFSESANNDGSISTTITATLTGDTFVTTGGAMTVTTEYTVANVPTGLTAVVTGTSATTATITFSGNASSHTNADDIANLTVSFADGAFTGSTASEVTNASKSDYIVDFVDIILSYDSNALSEHAANDGSISTVLNLTLSGDTFTVTGGAMTATTHYTVANIPAGLTAVITGTSATTATLAFTGNATSQNSADDVANATVTFTNAAFTGNIAAAVENYSKTDLSFSFTDPTTLYTGNTFTEAAANDGSIATTVTTTLEGDTYVISGGVMTASTHYSVANVPAGLTVVVTGTSTTTADITLTGNAASHANANDIANMTITFLDAAFTNSTAAEVSGYTRSDYIVDFIDIDLSYDATAFTEAGANDGSTTTVLNLTLAGDTFTVPGGAMTVTTHYTVANVPAGLTAVVTGTSGTTATLALTGNATNHNSAQDVSNITLTFTNAAFTGGIASAVTGYSNTGLSISFSDPSIAYDAGTFTEVSANDGSSTTTVTATLTGDTYVVPGGVMTASTHYSVANVPTGLTVVVTGTSATTATITLSGNAASHTNADDIANMTVTFLDAAFTNSTAAEVTNYSKADYVVDFIDINISYDGTAFTEAGANDGSTTTVLNLTLAGDTFTVPGGAMTVTTHYTVANVPAGLTAVVTGTSGTTATLALTGNATNHNSAQDVSNITLTFTNAAFTGNSASAVLGYSNSGLSISFSDPSIAYDAGTFTEVSANDGSSTTTVTATLTGDTYVVPGGVMTASTHYTVANVPAGLTVVVTGTSATTATITLSGNAASHTNADDIANLTVTFLDAAFTNSTAAEVTNYSKADYVVDFIDINLSYDASTFTEAAGNDGSITTTITATLTADTFTVSGGVMTATTHYTVANVPTGLTVVVTGTSATTATITLTGNAASHTNADDIANLTISFTDAAFTNSTAANVVNASKSDYIIDFIDLTLTYSSGTFVEAGANDGSTSTVLNLTLTGDTFVVSGGAMTETTHYTVANIPAGLTAVITGTSATSATIALTGNAASHGNADDVANITVTFLNAAFTGGNASAITNYAKNDIILDFSDVVITPVSDFAKTGVSQTTMYFGWTAATGATAIKIQQSTDNATWIDATHSAIATNATTAQVTGLTASTSYYFKLVVTGGANAGDSNVVTGITSSPPTSSSTTTVTPEPDYTSEALDEGAVALDVTVEVQTIDGESSMTVVVDEEKLLDTLNTQDQAATFHINIDNSLTDSNIVVATLSAGSLIQMESKDATLKLETKQGSYSIPADEIGASAFAEILGTADFNIDIEISSTDTTETDFIQNLIVSNNSTMIGSPVTFKVTVISDSTSIEVKKFNRYVSREIAIPSGVDPLQVTTAVKLDENNNILHVPTTIVERNGVYYAIINSMTNSAYTLISNQVTFDDTTNHWAKAPIENMASRLIVKGMTDNEFLPESKMTRAEFVSIVVQSIGIQINSFEKDFADIESNAKYANELHTAYEYNLISGYDGSFRGDEFITREEAMSIMANAVRLVNKDYVEVYTKESFEPYTDTHLISKWAEKNVAFCIENNIFTGYNNQIHPTEILTKAEATQVVYNMLIGPGLIVAD